MNKNFIAKASFLLIFILGWQISLAQNWENGFELADFDNNWLNVNQINNSKPFRGTAFHRTEANMEFGCGLSYRFPDTIHNQNLRLAFTAFFRSPEKVEKALVVLTLQRGGSLLIWQAVSLKDFLKKPSKWTKVSMQTRIPADQLRGSILKIYVWNPGKEQLDTDDFILSLHREPVVSFLPEIVVNDISKPGKTLFRNPFFSLNFDEKSGNLYISDTSGIAITRPIGVSFVESCVKRPYKNFQQKWVLQEIQHQDTVTMITFSSKNKYFELGLDFLVSDHEPQIHSLVKTRFIKEVSIDRLSIVIPFLDRVEHVYRKNSLSDDSVFQSEYYLDRQGVVFGRSNRVINFYHLEGISSAQLSQHERNLFLNLDYAADHPQIHFPLLNDEKDVFEHVSANTYQTNEILESFWNCTIGIESEHFPRLMPVPQGYEAAIIWTEHADWTNMRTQRAVNFGREDIIDIQQSTGGFAHYRIPVTKSVFYHNPDSITNSEISKGKFTELHTTIKSEPDFLPFLKQLQQAGFEICLHTPEQFTSSPMYLAEALAFMKDNFASKAWIDHGYNNKAENNREDFVCDGLNAESNLFAGEYWKENGVKYFWNPYSEDVRPFENLAFEGNLIVPYPGYGDCFPDRVISSNPKKYNGYLWSTASSLDITAPGLWNYYFSDERISNLMKFHSIYINHVYPAWVDESRNYWTTDSDGHIVAREEFNQVLAKLSSLRDAGRLWPATISQLIDYQESVKRIEYRILPDGNVEVENKNNYNIQGISFITTANAVLVNGLTPLYKKSGDELIFWFDLNAGEKVTIQTSK
jgi:hypothetical protein